MIQRFSFGHPFPTQSVVLTLPAESGPVPFLTPDDSGWRFTLSEQAAVYGLGEMPRGINKRGWHYITNKANNCSMRCTSFAVKDRCKNNLPCK